MYKKILSLMISLLLIASIFPSFIVVPTLAVDGTGTEYDPIIIATESALRGMQSGNHYALGNDIALGGTFTPIGKNTTAATRFSGGLDGNGFAVYGLHILY